MLGFSIGVHATRVQSTPVSGSHPNEDRLEEAIFARTAMD
jgi:hypothetical protein